MCSKAENIEDRNAAEDCDFRFFKNSCLQGLISGKLPDEALAGLQELDVLLQNTELNKDSRSTTAGAVELGGKKYFLKRYNNKTFKRKLKNSVRQTRPFKVLKSSQQVSAAGVFTPEVFAALNYRRGLLLESSYLISGYLESAATVVKILEELTYEGKLAEFMETSCRILVQIHEAGILHGDAKISNILIIPKPDNSYDLGLLDLDGTRCYSEALPARKRVRDLARLVSSLFTSCQNRKLDVMPLADLTAVFAEKYNDISGLNLAGDRLSRRTEYLSARVRKK
jgi:tRNA A-37 threonylcarbamoyl transferase component Bud32